MRKRDARIGRHVYHDRTGDYLGEIVAVGNVTVTVDGPRVRDGKPVTMVTIYECRIGRAPWEIDDHLVTEDKDRTP